MPTVNIIVVNYNGGSLTRECLKALSLQSFKDFSVTVIDNGSTDNSSDDIQRYLDGGSIDLSVKLVQLDINTGFSGGNEEGLKHTESDYIALLNNDTEPDRRWLEEMLYAMERDPEVGICASKLMVYGTNTIDSAGDGLVTSLKGFKRGEGKGESSYNEQEYIFGACAGAVLYRRKMIEEIGFLDRDFFLLFEDIDLNFRAQLAGWKVLYVPTAIVYHKVRSSIGTMSDTAIYYALRNSELVRIKNVPLGIFLRYLHSFIIGAIMDFIYYAIKHKKAGLYFKAKSDALKMLPAMLKKRKKIMGNRRVTNDYIKSIMTPLWQKSFLKSKFMKLING